MPSIFVVKTCENVFMRPPLFAMLLHCLMLLATCSLAEDREKSTLFNTYYLDGEGVSWILMLRADRSYEVINPEGQTLSGKFAASSNALNFTYGQNARRHFNFKLDAQGDLRLTPTAKDTPGKGGILGTLPPLESADKGRRFVRAENWRTAGKPDRPVAPKIQPEQVVKAMPEAHIPAFFPGVYQVIEGERRMDLSLFSKGNFTLSDNRGLRAQGAYLVRNERLILDSGFHKRSFEFAEAGKGLRMLRSGQDLLKPGDLLGELPPLALEPVEWHKLGPPPEPPVIESKRIAKNTTNDREKQAKHSTSTEKDPSTVSGSTAAAPESPDIIAKAEVPAKTALVELLPPSLPEPVQAAARSLTGSQDKQTPSTATVAIESDPMKPTVQAPMQDLSKAAERVAAERPAQAPSATVALTVQALIGAYRYRPSPLVEEYLDLTEHGFVYRDSNGARIEGTIKLVGNRLSLKAEEVIRHFELQQDVPGQLILRRTSEDNPKILNDLGTMSPSFKDLAIYERNK